MNKGIQDQGDSIIREPGNAVSLWQCLFSRQISWDLCDSKQTCRVCEHSHPELLVNILSSKSRFLPEIAFRMREISVSTCQQLVCHLFTFISAVFIKHYVSDLAVYGSIQILK